MSAARVISILALLTLSAHATWSYSPRPQTPAKEFNEKVRSLAEELVKGEAPRAKAEQLLLALGPPATEQLLATAALTRDPRQKEAIEALLPKYGTEAIERLLWGPGWDVRVYRGDAGTDDPMKDIAINAIVRMGPAALSEVRRLMERGAPRGAMAALNRMGPLGTETVVDVLLHHPDADMRRQMASILANAKHPDPNAADGLLKALDDKDTLVRKYAAQGVGNLRDRRAIRRLLELLHDSWHDTRRAAAFALGKMYEPRLFRPLSRMAQWDGDFEARQTASNVLMFWTHDPVAIRVGQRYYPPPMTEGHIDLVYLAYAILLVSSGMLVYLLAWFGARIGTGASWRGIPAVVLVTAGLVLLVGFSWAFWMRWIWGLIELLLLGLVIPTAALLAWRTGLRLKALRGSLVGCIVGVVLAVGAPLGGLLIGLGLQWLSSRLLVLIVGTSVLIGVLKKSSVAAERLASARRATLISAASFYAGYGVGWLALWGYLGF